MGVARYASDQEMAVKERVLLRDQMAFKLKLTSEEVDRIIFLRKAGDIQGALGIANRSTAGLNPKAIEGMVESAAAADILKAERANDDFFAGWSRGMQKYVADRDTALGMSADMARRAAQGMEQGFQKFFFDGMSGKFNSFKDVLKGVLDFTQQIVSQMAAQMVTIGIIKPGAGFLGSLFSNSGASSGSNMGASDFSGANFPKFASGGSFSVGGRGGTDTTPVAFWGTPGERVTVTPAGKSLGGGNVTVPIDIQIINQVSGAKVEAKQQTGPGGIQQIRILIREVVQSATADGSMDKVNQQRYGITPQPIGR